MIQKDISRGIVKPLRTNIFPAAEIEKAFRYMGSGKHMGKILLQMREHENDDHSLPIVVHPRIYCDPELSYVSYFSFKLYFEHVSKF
jgi:fatty acid synthase